MARVQDVEHKIDLKPRNGHRRSRARIAIPSQKRAVALTCALLALVTLAVYWRVEHNDFINYDDNLYVTENASVMGGLTWADLKWALTTGHTGYPHPLTWLTHQLDYQLYGNWAGGHHLTSVAIHVANALLLLLFLWRTTRRVWPSAFVAAVFALHPLHVESVAWIAERKDVLCGLFFFLTLHAYASYAKERSPRYYVLALLFFVAGLFSKPMIVTLPFVLFLIDIWPLGRLECRTSKSNGTLFLDHPPVNWGKAPIPPARDRLERYHADRREASRCHCQGRKRWRRHAHCQRGGKLCNLHLENLLATKPGPVLSVFAPPPLADSARFSCAAGGDFSHLH